MGPRPRRRLCRASVAGSWAAIRRGKLPGTADWDHQGANPGNTYCNEDRLVRPPFGILWFGEPGPRDVLDRHDGGSAPLVANGRLLVTGKNVVLAHDAYNGTFLWRREVPDVHRERMPLDCSGMAAAGDQLFLAAQDRCLRLAAATGAEEQVYRLPSREDGQKRLWGWIAVQDKLLLGSRTETPKKFRGWPAPRATPAKPCSPSTSPAARRSGRAKADASRTTPWP